MAQYLTMLMPVADKNNPLKDDLSQFGLSEGARPHRGGAQRNPDGTYSHPDFPGRTFMGAEDIPRPSRDTYVPSSSKSAFDRTLAEATKRAGGFDKRIETLETADGIFVHLKPGHRLPSGDTAFGADSLKQVREMMKSVIKDK
jgi:hypothetical protein